MIEKPSIREISCGTNTMRLCLALSVAIAAVGCAPTPEPTHQTVEYYRVNEEARTAKLTECENDPGALGQTADCINARQAAQQDKKTLRDLAPLNLPETLPSTAPKGSAGRDSGADAERRSDR